MNGFFRTSNSQAHFARQRLRVPMALLAPLSVSRLWGVGEAARARLERYAMLATETLGIRLRGAALGVRRHPH